ncbi:hypothetical protein FRX31_006634 [Thalictrum thalictroides]|uniref:Uncharacterized protein n=1 Tax=Thalictrum thalictroides TaxID=46969 RepID=A0A7J6X4L1_THATH|nr:hypothetical protein FRX31_006634 [Thalictrum thalictroides]
MQQVAKYCKIISIQIPHSSKTTGLEYSKTTRLDVISYNMQVAKKCALFLWNGPTLTNKMHQAKLCTICLEKEDGGLGLKDMRKWNVAANMGSVFKLARKEDGLWVDWVWKHHLKGKFLWTMSIPQDCSWVWRSVLKSRSDAAKYIKYTIADGVKTLLWHDLWCEASPLKNDVEAFTAWEGSFDNEATVDSLITNYRRSPCNVNTRMIAFRPVVDQNISRT